MRPPRRDTILFAIGWVILVCLLLWFVGGCVQIDQRKLPEPPPTPPGPTKHFADLREPEPGAPPPTICRLAWDRCGPEVVTYNVYSSRFPNMLGAALVTNTAATSVVLHLTKECEFFSVKAMTAAGRESDWATKGPCRQ